MIGLAGALLVVALVLAIWIWGVRGRMRAVLATSSGLERGRTELSALVDTLPIAAYRWRSGSAGEPTRLGAATASYAEFIAGLAPDDAERIEAGREALAREGGSFGTTARGAEGAVLQVEGRRTAAGEIVLWLVDMSAGAAAEEARGRAVAEAEKIREALDAISLPIWRRDDNLGIVDCNPAYAAALDASREAVLTERRELTPRNSRDQAHPAATASARGERRHVVIAGERRLLEISEIPVSGGGIVGFAVDRTDVETAEAELSRHIAAHADFLESIHAGVAIYGPDRRLKFFNTAFAKLWGIEEEWLAGEPRLDDFLERLRESRRIPEVADFPAYKRKRVDFFTSLIEPLQDMMHLPDGRTLRLLITPHPFGGLSFLYEDVTDRLALERSYNTLSEVQRATLDHLYEGIAVYGSDGRLKLHNPAYRRIWGLAENDVAGEPHIAEIVEKTRGFFDDRPDWTATKQSIIASVTAHAPSSGPLDRSDGSVLQIATVPLPDGNVLLTCLDVTDTARVERALRERNEALETAARLKSEFIASVSYELRTPLNAVIGFAEILSNQYFGPLTERQIEYSSGIVDAARQLMTLINDILDLATIEAGYMAIETSEVDVAGLVQSVVTLTHERARNQELSLLTQWPPNLGRIEGDERRLKQALFNLVSNAIKFTPRGGTITIAAQRENGELLLSVADTGIGIPAAEQTRVFEKFERGGSRSGQSGAGLGLSLVKSLVELHGGTVSLKSAPGQGTKVTCRLPATQPKRVAAEG